MTFEFAGDDDVWVYLDDALAIDLGGVHSELFGTIDFSTGMIYLGPSYASGGIPDDPEANATMKTTIRRMFEYSTGTNRRSLYSSRCHLCQEQYE